MTTTLQGILNNEKLDVVARARAKADTILLNICLEDIRALMEKTQAELAEVLGIKQAAIADMEKAGTDIKLSSLKRYVEAGGGKLSLDIELPDGRRYGFAL